MINVIINGEEKQYKDEITLIDMMNELGIADQVMAAAVNMNIVKQALWNEHVLNDGDKIELLDFVGGG